MIAIESVKHLESFARYGEVSNCFIKGLVVPDSSVYAFTNCVLVDCKMHFVAVGLSFENCKGGLGLAGKNVGKKQVKT